MNRLFVLLLSGLFLLSSCQKGSDKFSQDQEDALLAKKEAVYQLLQKYELEQVISMSDKLEDYQDLSLEEYEEKLKKFVAENQNSLQETKAQLDREEKMVEALPEFQEKMKNAATEEERKAIIEEYREVLNITDADGSH